MNNQLETKLFLRRATKNVSNATRKVQKRIENPKTSLFHDNIDILHLEYNRRKLLLNNRNAQTKELYKLVPENDAPKLLEQRALHRRHEMRLADVKSFEEIIEKLQKQKHALQQTCNVFNQAEQSELQVLDLQIEKMEALFDIKITEPDSYGFIGIEFNDLHKSVFLKAINGDYKYIRIPNCDMETRIMTDVPISFSQAICIAYGMVSNSE